MPTQPEPRTTPSDVIRLAAGLPPRPRTTAPTHVVSRITGAIHRLTQLNVEDDTISTACGLRLPTHAVKNHDELLHHEAHACLDCEVPA